MLIKIVKKGHMTSSNYRLNSKQINCVPNNLCILKEITIHVYYIVSIPIQRTQTHTQPCCVCNNIILYFGYVRRSDTLSGWRRTPRGSGEKRNRQNALKVFGMVDALITASEMRISVCAGSVVRPPSPDGFVLCAIYSAWCIHAGEQGEHRPDRWRWQHHSHISRNRVPQTPAALCGCIMWWYIYVDGNGVCVAHLMHQPKDDPIWKRQLLWWPPPRAFTTSPLFGDIARGGTLLLIYGDCIYTEASGGPTGELECVLIRWCHNAEICS